MPYIKVRTNVPVPAPKADNLKSALGQAITAIPGKSEGWLMTSVEGDTELYFKGTKDPAAMVEVQLYGDASDNAMNTLTSHITGLMTDQLGISSDRVYVSYMLTEHWGWNGGNF